MTVLFCPVGEQFVNPLFEVFDGGDFILSSYHDIETAETVMQIFFEDPADAPRAADALKEAGKIVGVELHPETKQFPDEDWKLAYRHHFKTEVISPHLVIRPPWEEFTPAAGQKIVTIDPGMAFGTGQHATTRACLELIDELAVENTDRSFLDVGTGSGILAVAAYQLGFKEVAGFDIDPDAVQVANETAELNGVPVKFTRGDLCNRSTLPDVEGTKGCHFDVVAANVLGPILIRFAKEIAETVNPSAESRLILSGILEEVYPDVKSAYEALGFKELKTIQHGEWKTGLFAAAM